VGPVRSDVGRTFYVGLLQTLLLVMGTAKRYLLWHGPRVAILSARLGDRLGLGPRERSEIFFAANLCDVGMIGLVEEAWENPVAVLPSAARAKVFEHPRRSGRTVARIPHLHALAPLVRHHHEWWDGSGYPDGLAGDAIPIGAQILRLADTVTALSGVRPHRAALSEPEIASIVRDGSGREFGPKVVDAYLSFAWKGLPPYDARLYGEACVDAVADLVPSTVSPLSTYEFLEIVASLIDAKDPTTGGHSRRVAELSVAVAEQLGQDARFKETLRYSGYLHDLGKLAVPLRVLTKPGELDDEDFDYIRAHPSHGADILENIPSLQHLTTGARYHHERWDGSGYPEGLSGDHIPVVAQILAVCGSYDAMTSARSYRDSRGHPWAVAELARCTGVHFAPNVVDAFMAVPEDRFAAARAEPKMGRDPFAREASSVRQRTTRGVTQQSSAG